MLLKFLPFLIMSCLTVSASVSASGPVKVYRLYDSRQQEHLFTADKNEVNTLTKKSGWVNEGVAWTAPEVGPDVCRLYNPKNGRHLWVLPGKERDKLLSEGWKDEGIAFNAWFPGYSKNPVHIYRLANPFINSHIFTKSDNERKTLMSRGWIYEGNPFNAYK